jgi:predicted kinase
VVDRGGSQERRERSQLTLLALANPPHNGQSALVPKDADDRATDDRHGAIDGATTEPIIIVSGATGVGKSTVSRLVAAAFDRSVHLQADDLAASVVSGWVDPNSPEGESQNWAIGAALAVSAMSFAEQGYTTIVDGHLFPDGVEGLATACAARGLSCHYVVLLAALDTCWTRASNRGAGRWPLEYGSFAALHARFADLDLPTRCVVDATGSAEIACDAVLSAFRDGRLVAREQPSTP